MSEIVIYNSSDNQTQIEVTFEQDSVWLTQGQIVTLFQSSKANISEHTKHIFNEGELEKNQTVRKFRTVRIEGKKEVSRELTHYNLDLIISVGYRVNSKQGTQFRRWATQRLKEYLIQGYALNEKRLKESEGKFIDLQRAVKLAAQAGNNENLSSVEAKGILGVLEQYAYALATLDKYDHQQLTIAVPSEAETKIERLSYENAIQQIRVWRVYQKAGNLFGNEKDQSFRSSLETIYQTFDAEDLYPSFEEKAANLLYFIVKNHSFSDGNKRIAAGLFVYFLYMNNKLLNDLGFKRIGDNALVAITIMIAESKSEEKDIMVKLVVNLINSNN